MIVKFGMENAINSSKYLGNPDKTKPFVTRGKISFEKGFLITGLS
jgi:hypothetical protein